MNGVLFLFLFQRDADENDTVYFKDGKRKIGEEREEGKQRGRERERDQTLSLLINSNLSNHEHKVCEILGKATSCYVVPPACPCM